MVDFDETLDEVKRGYRMGLASEEKISLLASLCDGPQIDRLIRELDQLQDSDLEDDSGDSADEYDRLRRALSHTLAQVGTKAICPLVQALDSNNPETRAFAAMALGEMKADAALDALVSHSISEVNWIAKRGLIQALGDLQDPRAAHVLSDMLSRSFDTAPGGKWVIRSAANAIGRIGGDIALKALTDLYLRSTDWFIRLGAVEGLSAMHGIAARNVLAEAAMDPDHRISEVAVAALRGNG